MRLGKTESYTQKKRRERAWSDHSSSPDERDTNYKRVRTNNDY